MDIFTGPDEGSVVLTSLNWLEPDLDQSRLQVPEKQLKQWLLN